MTSIGEGLNNLADLIRANVRAQKEFWQQVPALALEADRPPALGYSAQLKRAYQEGIWIPRSGVLDLYQVAIDLETGEIVDSLYPEAPLKDRDLLRAVNFVDLDDLDGKSVVIRLELLGQANVGDASTDVRAYDAYRQRIKREHGLAVGKPYEHPKAKQKVARSL